MDLKHKNMFGSNTNLGRCAFDLEHLCYLGLNPNIVIFFYVSMILTEVFNPVVIQGFMLLYSDFLYLPFSWIYLFIFLVFL